MSTERFIAFYQTFERIIKNIKRISAPVMQQYGLRSVHTTAVLAMRNYPEGLTVTELAKECFIDKALSSRMIRELTEGDFIVAADADSSAKNYNKRYVLTDKSRKMLAELNAIITEFVSEAGQNISQDELQAFYRVLGELDCNINTITREQNS